jgi:tRNA-dependent cyclodipeptide synthase
MESKKNPTINSVKLEQVASLVGYFEGYDLKNCNCLLPISVGQAYHEGGKFTATLKVINSTFGSATIVIADTLQRYREKAKNENLLDEEAYQLALKEGDNWLKKAKPLLDKFLNIKIKIIRWDDLLQHPLYLDCRKTIDNLYEIQNSSFRGAVHSSVGEFVSRSQRFINNEKFNLESNYAKLSIEYVKEESAVTLLWQKMGIDFQFLAYPNKLNQAVYNILQAIHQVDPHLLNSIKINIKNEVPQEIKLDDKNNSNRRVTYPVSILGKDSPLHYGHTNAKKLNPLFDIVETSFKQLGSLINSVMQVSPEDKNDLEAFTAEQFAKLIAQTFPNSDFNDFNKEEIMSTFIGLRKSKSNDEF